jgi:hypothetical protein
LHGIRGVDINSSLVSIYAYVDRRGELCLIFSVVICDKVYKVFLYLHLSGILTSQKRFTSI